MDLSDRKIPVRTGGMRRLSREKLSRGLFVLPTLFTVGNLFCGYLSIWCSIRGTFEIAAYLIIIAAVLDLLDGRIARLTNSTSEFGSEYDSLADLVSFGVAPAVLAYSWGLSDFFRLGWLASFLFVVCGSMRLARFNVLSRREAAAGHKLPGKFTLGLPIPPAASLLVFMVIVSQNAGEYKLLSETSTAVVVLVLSYLMVSRVRFHS